MAGGGVLRSRRGRKGEESDELMLLHCSPFVHTLHAPFAAVHALRCMHASSVKHSGGRWRKRPAHFP